MFIGLVKGIETTRESPEQADSHILFLLRNAQLLVKKISDDLIQAELSKDIIIKKDDYLERSKALDKSSTTPLCRMMKRYLRYISQSGPPHWRLRLEIDPLMKDEMSLAKLG
ncbi:MAG: hypothetical protein LUQ38_00045 [Methanotrichaceae archaeon]|nr:hypothetical protein [Methanotrichaceae archaeon]